MPVLLLLQHASHGCTHMALHANGNACMIARSREARLPGGAHPGSSVSETEISEVATTSTLTWFSRNTLNTLRVGKKLHKQMMLRDREWLLQMWHEQASVRHFKSRKSARERQHHGLYSSHKSASICSLWTSCMELGSNVQAASASINILTIFACV